MDKADTFHEIVKLVRTLEPSEREKVLRAVAKGFNINLSGLSREQHLLLILAEENAEVIQRVTKGLRFGLAEVQPEQPLTNAERIVYEMNDVQGALEMLQTDGALGSMDWETIQAKKAKVEKFLLYSQECGTLTA